MLYDNATKVLQRWKYALLIYTAIFLLGNSKILCSVIKHFVYCLFHRRSIETLKWVLRNFIVDFNQNIWCVFFTNAMEVYFSFYNSAQYDESKYRSEEFSFFWDIHIKMLMIDISISTGLMTTKYEQLVHRGELIKLRLLRQVLVMSSLPNFEKWYNSLSARVMVAKFGKQGWWKTKIIVRLIKRLMMMSLV